MFLKEPCFPDCWKLPFIVPVFNNIKESFVAKSYYLVGLFSIVGKTFEKIVNNCLLDDLGECGLKTICSQCSLSLPPKNVWFSNAFTGYRKGALGANGLFPFSSLSVFLLL